MTEKIHGRSEEGCDGGWCHGVKADDSLWRPSRVGKDK